MAIQFISPATEQEWNSYYKIRFEALRKPWGQPEGTEKDDTDSSSINVMMLENNIPVAVGRLHYNSTSEGQVRYMAVDELCRNKGYGSLILQELERIAKEANVTTIVLEARERAIPFYERNGYHVTKPSYLLFGEIQHYTMSKEL